MTYSCLKFKSQMGPEVPELKDSDSTTWWTCDQRTNSWLPGAKTLSRGTVPAMHPCFVSPLLLKPGTPLVNSLWSVPDHWSCSIVSCRRWLTGGSMSKGGGTCHYRNYSNSMWLIVMGGNEMISEISELHDAICEGNLNLPQACTYAWYQMISDVRVRNLKNLRLQQVNLW